jgi:hypothetical protein
MKEHEYAIKQALLGSKSRSDPADATTTALTQHCFETGHVADFENSYAIGRASTDYRLMMLESINIKASRRLGCLNGYETSLPVSDLWALNFEKIRESNQRKKPIKSNHSPSNSSRDAEPRPVRRITRSTRAQNGVDS